MEETFHPYDDEAGQIGLMCLTFFLNTNSRFFLQKYTGTLNELTPEDKKIAEMLVEECMWLGHNFKRFYF
jgi:hypothetical protein